MSLSDDLAAVFTDRAEQIRTERARALAQSTRAEQNRTDAADTLAGLFDQLDAAPAPEQHDTDTTADNDMLRRMIEGNRA